MTLYVLRAWRMRTLTASSCAALSLVALSFAATWPATVAATTLAPPMLDISRQCTAHTRRNATAMSECVVAESEARSELLQKWAKVSDLSAEKCIKAGKKAKKYPYSAMAKCLAVEPIEVQAPQAAVPPAVTAENAQSAKKECSPLLNFKWIKSLRPSC